MCVRKKGAVPTVIEDGSFSSLAPVCLGIAFTGPGGVQMTFLPFAYYKDAAVRANPFSPQSVPGEQFDGMSLVRYRKRAALPQYAYERIAAITKTTQLRVEPMDFPSSFKRSLKKFAVSRKVRLCFCNLLESMIPLAVVFA